MTGLRVRRLATRLALVAAIAAVSGPVVAGGDPVLAPPVESLPPVLLKAKQELADIVARRDFDALLAHVDTDTKLSFGGDHGADGFRLIWDESPRSRQHLWRELDAILALPGVARGTEEAPEYCAPYVFCIPTPGAIDAYDALVVTGTRVALRDRPSTEGKVLSRIGHVVVRRAPAIAQNEGAVPREWIRVRLASGATGYVSMAWVRSPIDYRLRFSVEPASGTWRLDYFLADD